METNNKLREALAKIRSEAYECDKGGEYLGEGPDPGFDRIIKMCDAALATPIRNCDVGTARQQEKRHKEEVCPKSACPKHEGFVSSACKGCFAMWSQMPYKEGGAK